MADADLNPDSPVLSLTADDFTLFGLPRRFGLDAASLDAAWKRLQSAAHPDRFATEGAAAQRLAMQWAMRINEAYARLKSPLARAAYLCQLHGQDLEAERNTAMPASFLMQQMAWREALDEADGLAAVQSLADEVAASRSQILRDVGGRIDASADLSAVDWAAVAAQVRGLMFVEKFAADIDRRLDALDA